MSPTKKALCMIRGKGNNAVTHYSCGVMDQARKEHLKILIMKRDRKTGKMVPTAVDPRRPVHRDLLSAYCDTHELAGQGKYIDLKAFPKGSQTRVVGAQYVNTLSSRRWSLFLYY